MNLNKLLSRQVQKYLGGLENVPAGLHGFLMAVSESYDHYEKDHRMLERSIDLSSAEMIELNSVLRQETKKLKAADDELRKLFQNIDEVFFSVDMRSYKLIQISEACEKIYGYSPTEFYTIPDLWRKVVHPSDINISDQQVVRLKKGENVFNQYRIIHKNGSERWIENKIIPTLEDGNLVRLDGITSDITARKKTERLILESEKKYRLVFENPFLGVALGTMEGVVMNANKAFYSLLGYTHEEIQNVHFSTFTYALDMEKEMPFIKKMANGELNQYQLEKRYITKQNEIIWVELSVSCVKNEADQIQFVVAVIQDITAKKKSKESLLKSEANLMNILENTDTAYVLLDNNGDILSFNKIARNMGIEEIEESLEIGKNYADLMFEDRKNAVRAKIKNVLAHGKPVKYETSSEKNDATKWFYVSMHPIFGENKHVIGLSVAVTNITERKKTETLISGSNERYELVTKATKDIIWDWNLSEERLYRSSNYEQVFGYSNSNNIYDKPSWENIHTEDRERIKESIMKRIGDPAAVLWEDQYRYYRANGELAYVDDRGYIIRDDKKKTIRVVGAMRDITDEKTLQNERSKMTSDLLQRNRDLEQFAYIISHNLRSPLANIIGLMNLFQNDLIRDNDEYKKCIKGLLLSTNKLDTVIKDISYILQVRREINEKKEPVLFSELVADIKISINNLLQTENALIETNFEIDQVFTLKSYMYSIFYNLISNSLKYRNGVTPIISISSEKRNNKIFLIFKDNGLGIDLKVQRDKIFGLYNKFHFHKEGKGMGLYMTKTQVEILGGKIDVKSDVNQGTEFFIELER
ncbi:MAG: kinE 2 [Bacteroidetes bacterium]|nr:kinE 2 [Bacteroidota bacterium]